MHKTPFPELADLIAVEISSTEGEAKTLPIAQVSSKPVPM